ncbi:uncharacterized protein F5147DRAFT_783559 [Suillus discolor]|uniref:Uncharacterized protein n=1 Tax=Suillus discolor TaxID=1912936 RepID=A0A9P7JKK0_9AGAM|nr:uncharacterized protein F5147DRAFT_783559 [Suillus discolor]KAG2081714.1 hypothetical protein F5147DRAFT_783559 [Suillus discolor]
MQSKHSSLDILIDARDPKSRELIGQDVRLIYNSRKSKCLYLQPTLCRLFAPPLCLFVPADGPMASHNPTRGGSAASCLEFIKLKRSNDFYHAHAEQFLPPLELDSVPFAILTGASDQDTLAQVPAPCHPLPKLRHVDIFGIPLNWAGFICTLGVGHCIQSLELSYHDRTLRPTFDQFSAIINVCPLLRRLLIRESGPVLSQPYHCRGVVSLPMLEELHLGYVGYVEMDSLIALLSRLDTPNLVALSIEDVNPIIPRAISETSTNIESLLSYCATGFSKHPAAVSRTGLLFPKLHIFMSAFSKLHDLLLLRTPNALAALLLDVDATIPLHSITSILVSPVTQPEFLKLKQLKNVDLVLMGDVEELSPSISYPTISESYYYDWATW